MWNKLELAEAWVLMAEDWVSYFADYDCPKEENPEYLEMKEVFGDLADFNGETTADFSVREQESSSIILNTEESYVTIFGEQRKGKKIDEGFWYLDSELNIPIATNKPYESQFKREDFECVKEQNVYKTVKGHVFGYIHKIDKDLVLESITDKIHSISTGEVVDKLKGEN